MPNFYALGQKHAAEALGVRPQDRSYLKDFAAGVDPTGTYTTEYGMSDVGTDTSTGARRGVGVLGGLIGGGLVVPSAISGLMHAPTGKGVMGKVKAFGEGFMHPSKEIVQGIKAKRILHRAPKVGITKEEMRFLGDKAKSQSPVGLSSRIWEMQANRGLTPQQYRALPKAAIRDVETYLGQGIKDTAIGMGLGGAFSGGSAYAQYGKGRNMGEQLDQATRDKLTS